MAGTTPALNNTTTGATRTNGPLGYGLVRPPAQVLSELMDTLTTLMGTEVKAENQAEHNTEIAKLRERMTKAQEDLNAENARTD